MDTLFLSASCPRDKLLERVRLKGLPQLSNVNDLVDQAISRVRITFLTRLSTTRIAEIQALPDHNDLTTTPDQILKFVAEHVEIELIRLDLICGRLPNVFQDAASAFPQQWNEAGLQREGSEEFNFLSAQKSQIEAYIQPLWDVLTGVEPILGNSESSLSCLSVLPCSAEGKSNLWESALPFTSRYK